MCALCREEAGASTERYCIPIRVCTIVRGLIEGRPECNCTATKDHTQAPPPAPARAAPPPPPPSPAASLRRPCAMQDEEFGEADDDVVSSFLNDDFREQVDFTGGSRRSFLDHSLDAVVSMGSALMAPWGGAYEPEVEAAESARKAPRITATSPAAAYAHVVVKQEPGTPPNS